MQAPWRIPFSESGILDFFLEVIATDDVDLDLSSQTLRLIGNACADTGLLTHVQCDLGLQVTDTIGHRCQQRKRGISRISLAHHQTAPERFPGKSGHSSLIQYMC